jgi:hypothetical protein
MTTVFPEAKIARSGGVKPIAGERELKRCPRAYLGDSLVTLTLTNHRILIASREEKKPRELKLSDVVKAKVATGSRFKGTKKPELTIKMTDDTKHKISFDQLIISIYSPFEERDEFLQLLSDNLMNIENPANPNQEV